MPPLPTTARHEDRQRHGSPSRERQADASGDDRPPDLDARTRQHVQRDVAETAEPCGGEEIGRPAAAAERPDHERYGTRDRQGAGEGMRADFVGAKIHVPAEGHDESVHIRRECAEDAGDDPGPEGRRLPAERRRERLS